MRRDIEFNAEGTILRGWLYLPEHPAGHVPGVVMAHGFTAVKEMYLDRYAEVFAAAGPPTTVLCIDDDPLVLHFYRGLLEPRGYRTLTAADGLVGVEVAKWDHPDVILLDVMLRGLSGFDICRKLRDEPALRQTPIILLTVWDHPSVALTGREAGATVTLRKPAAAEAVVTTIAQCWSSRVAHHSPEGGPGSDPPRSAPSVPAGSLGRCASTWSQPRSGGP